MPKKLTHEEYINEVAKINSNIEVLDAYINSRTKILHKCKIDGYEWCVKPNTILKGHGCPKCGGKMQKTHEQYVNEVFAINPNIEVVGIYVNNKTSILHRCKICEYEWGAIPSNILNGFGCSMCSNKKKKTHEEYIEEVARINQDIEVIGEYVNNKTKILHRCKIDGYEWHTSPHQILSGYGCPKCSMSKGEKIIISWLNKKKISYESQKKFNDCRDIFSLSFDFYLPDYNICIEYQGIQHYCPIEYFGGEDKFVIQQKHDNIKREYCKKNNIFLFEIPYYSNLDNELIKLYEIIKEKNVKKGVVA